LTGLADLELAGVGLLQADDRLEQRRLADAVRADDADDAVARQRERQVVDEHPVAEALAQVVRLDDTVAQRGPGGIWISSKSSLRVFSASRAISS
jgi:hypothetical protein